MRDAVRALAVAAHPEIYEPSEVALPSTEGAPGFVVPTDVPARKGFDAVAQLTPPLAQIYESGEEGIFVATSIGTGWRITPDALASSLIASAGRSIIFAGGDTDAATLADEAVKMLDDLIALLSGEAISVTVVGALSGIALPPGTDLQLPWGRVRNVPQELALMGIFSNRRPHLVLIGSVEVTLYVQDDSKEPPNIFDPGPLRRFSRAAVLLPLAALLGIEGENYLAPQWLWQTTLLPAGLGNAFSGTALGSRPLDQFLVAAKITKDQATSLEEWASLVDSADDSTIEVAIRRVLSAVRERVDYEDALIDAVVAMESLFGHGDTSEVTFRVTSAIAILLEPDASKRAGFRTALGKVYSTRSKVVHGGVPDGETLHAHKEEAIRMAVSCLRCLYAENSHLIPAKDRGMRLILRTEQPTE